ncbi:hypothetical protein PENTCL1PPCAC_30641 [Pristionchus entomophagus]|uniref:Fibrinogen C-terminal domain-containing protein n=1 Tax=Pristionchus entomophagus TaxID=358040 RepID=A0AAV5UN48_9BILA|nr:hypothetical protein PENTCL1PPCAC_30641 [Pristionchus entomophagus]
MRTRPSSVFPTVPLRASSDEISLERRTETIRESCMDHANAALGSGVYRISPDGGQPFDVYCRMDEDVLVGETEGVFRAGGAWTYVQSLSEEAYFYNRTFVEYQRGIGRVDKSHWLGLDFINRIAPETKITTKGTHLRIELYGDHCSDANQCSGRPDGFWWGEWEFGLAPVDDLYRLHISPAQQGNLTVHTPKDVFYEMNNGHQSRRQTETMIAMPSSIVGRRGITVAGGTRIAHSSLSMECMEIVITG